MRFFNCAVLTRPGELYGGERCMNRTRSSRRLQGACTMHHDTDPQLGGQVLNTVAGDQSLSSKSYPQENRKMLFFKSQKLLTVELN